MGTSLSDRMKAYEECYRIRLPNRVPKVIRIDGRSFSSVLSGVNKPYDIGIMSGMMDSAMTLMQDIGGTARLAYLQSDECSILLNDNISLNCQSWFDGNLNKTVSISAASFTETFSRTQSKVQGALFDSRFFVVPDNDVVNYLVWRQQDATRNSITMYASAHYSHRELDCKSGSEKQDMLMAKGVNWNDMPTWTKRGLVLYRNEDNKIVIDDEIPIFTQDREYIVSKYEIRDATSPVEDISNPQGVPVLESSSVEAESGETKSINIRNEA
jgi:tRNA(His) guanylyltransferase